MSVESALVPAVQVILSELGEGLAGANMSEFGERGRRRTG